MIIVEPNQARHVLETRELYSMRHDHANAVNFRPCCFGMGCEDLRFLRWLGLEFWFVFLLIDRKV